MKINIGNHDFSILWDGVYYKALSDYPKISEWELKSILDFVSYEKEYGRQVEFESENNQLLDIIKVALETKEKYSEVKKPIKITECTACKHKGCMTDFLCHIAPLENSMKILKSGKLLAATKVRITPIKELLDEARNAANDPADFFEYVMFSWGNCQAGDRLVMERKFNRPPTEDDLSTNFTPGVRFYFKYDDLIEHPDSKQDGYHALKIKNQLILIDYISAIVIPEKYKYEFQDIISDDLVNKVHYIKNDCNDIWDWSEKVYEYICDQ